MATVRLDPLKVKKFLGRNLDISEEKLPPGALVALTNMKLDIDGDLSRVDGCTLQKDVSGVSNALKEGLFSTRGENYIFLYHADKKVRIYTWPDFEEITYSTKYIDIDTLTFNEKPWFAVHSGEMYIGNMADGMWRWKLGHQPLMRGSAPNDIIVQLGEEEGEKEKDYTEWEFAYDYEKNGGRSPLSRKARAKLYNNLLTVKVIMDTPPVGSRGRRVYASPDEGTTWYFVKEITDNDSTFTVLDSELVDNITDSRKYGEDTANAMSPHARFGVSYMGKLYVGYTINSPSEILSSEIGKSYFNYTSAFDLKEPITNLVVFGNVVASGLSKISICQDEPKRMDPIAIGLGAFEGSMAVVNNKLYFANEYGWLEYSSKGLKRVGTDEYLSADDLVRREGLVSANFTGLKKPMRTIFWTDQGDFEQGEYNDGISSDVFPGALSLQQNVIAGVPGILAIHTANSGDYGKTQDGSYCESFEILGDSAETAMVEAVSLLISKIQGGGNPDDPNGFIGELRKDNGEGKPDMTTEGLESEFSGNTVGDKVYFEKFKLTEKRALNRGTTYWLVIPKKGIAGCGWILYGNDWNQFPMYMRGRCYWSEGGGSSWIKHDHIQDLAFMIHGKSPDILADRETGYHGMLESKNYQRAFPIIVPVNQIKLSLLEIIGDKVGSPAAISTAAIHADDDGKPGAKIYDIPTFTELNDPEWEEEGFPGDIFTFQATFDAGKTLATGNYWIVLPEIGTGTNDYYKWIQATNQGGSMRSDDGGSTWEADGSPYVLWFKLWATVSSETFASSGNWITQKVSIGANDDFGKVFWSRMVPEGATAKLYIDEDETGSWTEITSQMPYTVTADVTTAQFKVELAIGTANFTPIVDSILLTYTKENDEGDILRAGNVNGEFFLSRIDDDGDGSEEFTLVLSKTDTIHTLSEPFYDYLSVAEKTTLGIGKNTNDDLNIYKLDEGNKWYKNDTGNEKDIDTEIETGKMLYDSMLKLYRKMFLHVKAKSDLSFYLDIIVGGGERELNDEIIEVYSDHISMETTSSAKPVPFSLPDRMQGNWIKIKIVGEDADWSLHGFEIYPYGKTGRILASFSNLGTVKIKEVDTFTMAAVSTLAFDGNNLFTVPLNSGSGVNNVRKYYIDPVTGKGTLLKTISCPTELTDNYDIKATNDYVYISTGIGLWIFDHNLTLVGKDQNIAAYASKSQLVISDNEQYGWFSANSVSEKKIYYIDLSDKANPSHSVAASGKEFFPIAHYENYLFVGYEESGHSYLCSYDASVPTSLNLLDTIEVGYEACWRAIIINKIAKRLYYLNDGTDSPQIIDISDVENLSILATGNSSMNGALFTAKGKHLFVTKDIGGGDCEIRIIDTENYSSLKLESTYSNPTYFDTGKTTGIAYNGDSLFAIGEYDTPLVHIWKIYG